MDIIQALAGKWEDGTRPKDLYSEFISQEPADYIDTILDGLKSEKKRIQSGCAELASFLSEDMPNLLYPYVDLFVKNLDAKAPVLRWEAVCTIGNLARVDDKGVTKKQITKISSFLSDKSIVLQGHAIRALGKIAMKHPDKALKIFLKLSGAAAKLPGNRVGFLVTEMASFAGAPKVRKKALKFAESYIESEIGVVAKKAKKAVRILSNE